MPVVSPRPAGERVPVTPAGRPHPLIVTHESGLLDDLLRLAAAGGAEVRVAHDLVAARADWPSAPFVILGADCVPDGTGLDLPPRTSLILVGRADDGDRMWRCAPVVRAEHVAVLPDAEGWLVDRFSDHAAGGPGRARVLAVVGGRGGAGASVFAAALAVMARRQGLDTLLIDADPFGGGVDVVLGWERMNGLRWPDLYQARGRVNPPALVRALPGEGSLAVLSFDRSECADVPVEAMAATLDAGRRGRDLVVIDLPRRFDAAALFALTAADRCYLVVPAELRACAAARRIAAVAGRHCPAVELVVRTPAPPGVRPSDVAAALDLPLVAVLPPEPRLARSLESGDPPARSGRGPLAEVCRRLLADLTPRHRLVSRS